MRLDIRAGFWLFVIVCCLALTEQALIAIFAAMVLHEAGHLLVARVFGGHIGSVRLRFADARIELTGLGYRAEMWTALAGPVANLAGFCLFSQSFSMCSLFCLLLAAYNLLPIWPLDGGRALRLFLLLHLPPTRADTICRAVGYTSCALLMAAAMAWTARFDVGIWPCAAVGALLLRLLAYTREEICA